ncbi:MAG: LytR/AlgR family response regulator transcription factor [Cyclobacteriaceae bacterium]
MAKLKAILVDDEQDSRDILSNYLKKYCPDVDLLATCDSVKTGLEAITTHQPDVVFLDIEMPYANGFDLLDQVNEITFETVFVTAYDNYAIKALNQSAAYYLLKPIDIDELVAAVEKIQTERSKPDYVEHAKVLLENIKGQPNNLAKLMLPTLEGFEVVKPEEILYCEADNNFTKFHLVSNRQLLICRTLKYFEEILSNHQFVRVHRSHMINLDYVVRYTKGKGGYVTLENGAELEVAPKKKSEFLEAFQR